MPAAKPEGNAQYHLKGVEEPACECSQRLAIQIADQIAAASKSSGRRPRKPYQLAAGLSPSDQIQNFSGQTSIPSNRSNAVTANQGKGQEHSREATTDHWQPKPQLLLQKEEDATTLNGEHMLGRLA